MFQKFIIDALEKASEIANKNFGKSASSTKEGDNNQVLTVTDLAVGKLIIELISKEFPDSNIIDEEAGVIDRGSDMTWVVDPIDGTSNFANCVPTYGVMLGLLKNETPVAGGIALPFFREIYSSEKGKGAFKNNERVFVSKEETLLKSLVAYQIDGHQENPDLTYEEGKILSKVILNIRNLRTSNSAFDACQVACGNYGAFANKTSKIWDNVAQQSIIEEAGGVYTDFTGRKIDYSNPLTKAKNNFTYCAGSLVLHDQLIAIINN